eukprot:TRINITY_DN12529_c0_g1_i5.p1 TRINITY_DN12529_c0_g1~~TRINITY_DN12529_c0_g1_i5.p1  ORF type:complete len:537 (+),score=110.67 TRINITY_DN12529_c0_g1_i5:111-1721(+)
MIRRPPRSTLSSSSAASDVYKRQEYGGVCDRTMVVKRRRSVTGLPCTAQPSGTGPVVLEMSELVAENVPVCFSGICLDVTNQENGERFEILKDVSGSASPGELMAIMGPSGAGKTSLINVLSRRISSSEISGSCSLHDGGIGKHQIGFVFQDDLLLSELTVRETILFSAMLRLPEQPGLDERVDQLIADLGLTAARDTRIGNNKRRGVSGGERKRTAIGVELVTRPAVLFLDEPTSGLDASTALALARTLKKLCDHGHTVVCTIHQPRSNILWLFSKVLLLHSGRTAFVGNPQDAIVFLEAAGQPLPAMTNPADFFMDALTSSGPAICDAWACTQSAEDQPSTATAPPATQPQRRWVTSFCRQLVVLFRRHNAQSRGDTFTPVNSFVVLFMAGFTALLWWQSDSVDDVQGLLFFILIQQGFNAMNGVLRVFPDERTLVMRERSNGAYHVGAYFLAKTSADMLNTFALPALFAVIVWLGVGFEFEVERFLVFMGMFLASMLSAQSMGLFLSCVIIDANSVQVVIPNPSPSPSPNPIP